MNDTADVFDAIDVTSEDLDAQEDLEDADVLEHERARPRRTSFNAFKAKLQQKQKAVPPPAKDEPPWWATAPREGLTKTAEAQRERMERTKVAKTVAGQINEI